MRNVTSARDMSGTVPGRVRVDTRRNGCAGAIAVGAVAGPPYTTARRAGDSRFAGIRTYMRAPHVTDLAGVDAAVYGIPFDTATSYRTGARFGPEAIRSASALIRPYHPRSRRRTSPSRSRSSTTATCPSRPATTERTYGQIEEALAPIVDAGVFPVRARRRPLDHARRSSARSAKRHGPLALVQLDAHADTWEQYFGQKYFHGTTFKRAVEEDLLDATASVQAGMRGSVYAASDLGTRARARLHRDRERGPALARPRALRRARPREGRGAAGVPVIRHRLPRPGLRARHGTPEVAGFSTAEALAFLRALRGIDLVGCDVVEVAPGYDGPGQPTALAAANVVFELLALRVLATPRP